MLWSLSPFNATTLLDHFMILWLSQGFMDESINRSAQFLALMIMFLCFLLAVHAIGKIHIPLVTVVLWFMLLETFTWKLLLYCGSCYWKLVLWFIWKHLLLCIVVHAIGNIHLVTVVLWFMLLETFTSCYYCIVVHAFRNIHIPLVTIVLWFMLLETFPLLLLYCGSCYCKYSPCYYCIVVHAIGNIPLVTIVLWFMLLETFPSLLLYSGSSY